MVATNPEARPSSAKRRSFQPDNGGFHRGESLFDQWDDFLVPQLHRRLPSAPTRQAANPFHQQDAILVENLGDSDAASVNGQLTLM